MSEDKIPDGEWAEVERQMNIHRLKNEAQAATEGQMTVYEEDDAPSEVVEQFWQHVVRYERAGWTTNFAQLEHDGVALPPPEALDDAQLTVKLWEVIEGLAARRVYLSSTDHLSDRELYSHLWHESLREEVKDIVIPANGACHLDLLGSGSEEDVQLVLKYYADEDWRSHWLDDFPDCVMPDHEDPPYDRDRLLPQPDYSAVYEGALPDDFDDWDDFDDLDETNTVDPFV